MSLLTAVLLIGMLCSVNWMMTCATMTIVTFSTMTYYNVQFGFYDSTTYLVLLFTLIMLTTSTYMAERQDKVHFMQLANIQKMNEELTNILMNLPEGIVLVNEQSNEVALGNNEFRRLFSIPKALSNEAIGGKLQEQVLISYNNKSLNYDNDQETEYPSGVLQCINDAAREEHCLPY
jgi:c-di-AMP phosphodiesterase-like protein